ncbi:MAG: BtrH N-terminal domain-containing protein, partial [Gammaproteobacteria bacterium]
MSAVDFSHQQAAHCESGAISSLLTHNGLPLSEPMALGISGALTYAYIPLIKVAGLPLIAYRMPPGKLIRGVTRRLGIKMRYERFRDQTAGMDALSGYLRQGKPVGLQTSVYWLPYFPEDLRFHFNAHNLVVYGQDDDEFLISDPTFEQPVRADYASLKKSRFVRGMAAPKGLLYYPEHVPADPDMAIA